MELAAPLASVDDCSVVGSAAEDDCGDHLPVLGGHGAAEAAQVFGIKFRKISLMTPITRDLP